MWRDDYFFCGSTLSPTSAPRTSTCSSTLARSVPFVCVPFPPLPVSGEPLLRHQHSAHSPFSRKPPLGSQSGSRFCSGSPRPRPHPMLGAISVSAERAPDFYCLSLPSACEPLQGSTQGPSNDLALAQPRMLLSDSWTSDKELEAVREGQMSSAWCMGCTRCSGLQTTYQWGRTVGGGTVACETPEDP